MSQKKFMFYDIIMQENTGSEKSPHLKEHHVQGIVENTPRKLGRVFMQHPELLRCSIITKEDYFPMRQNIN